MKNLRAVCEKKNRICRFCKHFSEEMTKDNDGYCHRRSPSPFGWMDGESMKDRSAIWPAVQSDDFCNEFESGEDPEQSGE